jgi:hypothetical protein
MATLVAVKEPIGSKVQVAIKQEDWSGLLLLEEGPRLFSTDGQAEGWLNATALRRWGVEAKQLERR